MIEAFRLVTGVYPIPEWFILAMQNRQVRPPMKRPPINGWAMHGMLVQTPDGEIHAQPGDWVVQIEEHLYVVKPADFEGTFIPLDDLNRGS